MGDRFHGMARRAEGSGLNRGVRFGAPIPRTQPCAKGDNGSHRGRVAGGPRVRILLPPAKSQDANLTSSIRPIFLSGFAGAGDRETLWGGRPSGAGRGSQEEGRGDLFNK
jgi:hypothetical protein